MAERAPNGQGIQSVETGGAVLEAVVEAPQPLRLKEVASLTGLTASKARMYLVSLTGTALGDQDIGARYRPARQAVRLVMLALGQDRLMRAARSAIIELGERTGHPVLLSAWDRDGSMIVASNEAREPLPLSFKVGSQTPLDTATGMVFLTYMPESERTDLARTGLPDARRAALPETLAGIRARGFATASEIKLSADVTVSGYGAIAVPVFGRDERLELVVTALHLSGLSPDAQASEIETLKAVAARVRVEAGFDPSQAPSAG